MSLVCQWCFGAGLRKFFSNENKLYNFKTDSAKRQRVSTKDRASNVAEQAKLYHNPPLPKGAIQLFAGALVDKKHCRYPIEELGEDAVDVAYAWYTNGSGALAADLEKMILPWGGRVASLLDTLLASIASSGNRGGFGRFPAPKSTAPSFKTVSDAEWYITACKSSGRLQSFGIPGAPQALGLPHYMCFSARSGHSSWASCPIDGVPHWLHCISGKVLVLCVSSTTLGTPAIPSFDIASKLHAENGRVVARWFVPDVVDRCSAQLMLLERKSVAWVPVGTACYFVVADDCACKIVAVPHLSDVARIAVEHHESIAKILKTSGASFASTNSNAWIGEYAQVVL